MNVSTDATTCFLLNATCDLLNGTTDSVWPLRSWYNVDPFKIDALGLVTLLGAPEVNRHIGKLVRSRYLEYLPLLGAYIIASDEFTDKQPGYQLYNIDTKIYTPDIAGWFARWLMTQDFRTASSYVQWEVESVSHSFKLDIILGITIGVLLNGFFLTVAVLMGDWWGFANAMSMAISTVARATLVDCNRRWLDQAIEAQLKNLVPQPVQKPNKPSGAVIVDDETTTDLKRHKLIVILPDARAVALRIPDCLVKFCFVYSPKPPDSKDETKLGRTFPPKLKESDEDNVPGRSELRYYKVWRAIAWAAFGAHVVTIGMSCLVSQIITVFIIVGPTILITYGFGCDQTRIGTRLRASMTELPHCTEAEEKRVDMYAFLDLEPDQDDSLHQWSLTPHKTNTVWWDDYRRRKKAYHGDESKQETPLIDLAPNERKEVLQQRLDATAAAQQPDPSTQAPPKPIPNARHVAHEVT